MNADLIPTSADMFPIEEIAIVLLAELLFGIGYNALVAYWNRNKLVHVSLEVAIGVLVALLIPVVVWFSFWKIFLVFMLCFVACGIPMIVGSMTRTVKDQKKRKVIVGTSARIRDEAVMEVNAIIQDVTEKAKNKELHVNDLVVFIGRLHALIGMLKSI